MCLAKTFVGRKWESLIWNYFHNNEQMSKWKCRIVDTSSAQTRKECRTVHHLQVNTDTECCVDSL